MANEIQVESSQVQEKPKKTSPVFVLIALVLMLGVTAFCIVTLIKIFTAKTSSVSKQTDIVKDNLMPRLNNIVNEAYKDISTCYRIGTQAEYAWSNNQSTLTEEETKKLLDEIEKTQKNLVESIDKIVNLENDYKDYFKKEVIDLITKIEQLMKSNKKDDAAKLFDYIVKYYNTILAEFEELRKKLNEIGKEIYGPYEIKPTKRIEDSEFFKETQKYKDLFTKTKMNSNSTFYNPRFQEIVKKLVPYKQKLEDIKKSIDKKSGLYEQDKKIVTEYLAQLEQHIKDNKKEEAIKVYDSIVNSFYGALQKFEDLKEKFNELAKQIDKPIFDEIELITKEDKKAILEIKQVFVNARQDLVELGDKFDESLKNKVKEPLAKLEQLIKENKKEDATKLYDETIKLYDCIFAEFGELTQKINEIGKELGKSNEIKPAEKRCDFINTVEKEGTDINQRIRNIIIPLQKKFGIGSE